VVIDGAVGFHFDVLLLPGNDDVASVPADVDDIAEIDRREVVEVARLMLLLLYRTLPAFGAFGIPEPTTFLLNIVPLFYLHSVHGVESVLRRLKVVEAARCVRILTGCIEEVVLVIINVVVIQLDMFQTFIIRDVNHEYFMFWHIVFYF
jgi:hypothetical protein